ncbi:MAG: hypothetical protein NUV53_00675 [Patescibacteria group bacterium]|nr:hypothetical protein [Patescibacteria group bacterium]
MRKKRALSPRVTHVLTGIGISLTSFLLVLGVFLAAITIVKLIRAYIESRFDAVIETAQHATNSIPLNEELSVGVQGIFEEGDMPERLESLEGISDLTFASFSDLFSSDAALDKKNTTMHRDSDATAFLFRPNTEWNERQVVGDESSSIHSQSCIQSVCLETKGTVLVKDGGIISLPQFSESDGSVYSVSADVIGDVWVVGIVRAVLPDAVAQERGRYAGYVYYYDGKQFTPIFENGGRAFVSEFLGTWGFGGISEDFLAVYGGYEGKGFRIRGGSSKFRISDLSWLFGVRIMQGGITPGIIRVGSGVATTWYMFNKERASRPRPIFLKLFQNGTEEIVGEADLLGTAPQQFSYLTLTKEVGLPNSYSLAVYAELKGGNSSSWLFHDKGFQIPSGPVIIQSNNLNNYENAEVPHILRIDFREFSAGDASIALEVKNTTDGEWELIKDRSEGLWFKNSHGTELYWKATITPGNNPYHTPFLGILDLDYEVKRLNY